MSRLRSFDDQVEVALAVLEFLVCDPVTLVGHRTERFREHGQALDFHRRFTDLSVEGLAADTDPVTEVEQLERLELIFRDTLGVDVALDAPLEIGDVEKVALAHIAVGGHAAGDRDFFPFSEVSAQGADLIADLEAPAEWVDPEGAQFLDLLLADVDQFLLGGAGGGWVGGGCVFVGHW